ncbi:MAG TPA: recombinase family protein [Chthoniobacterales bacterium]|nr:recombinase family protein [Chthoniobacterales bacterium]
MRVDSWESLGCLDCLGKYRVPIIADGTEIDFSSFATAIPLLFAADERLDNVQKISDSKAALRLEGKLASGGKTLPFAVRYSRRKHKFRYDVKDIWRVQKAFELVDLGNTNLSSVARATGFQRTGIRYILTNPIYIGIRRYDTKRDPNVKRVGRDGRKTYRPKIRLLPEEILEIRVIAQPAVPPDRFQRVQRILEELRLNHVATLPKEKRVHLCTTYGRCGCCGQALYISGNGKKDKVTGMPLLWYCCRSQHPGKKGTLPRCTNSWTNSKKLNALLVAFATSVLTDPELLTGLIRRSIKLSSDVIRPFPKRGGVQELIAKLEKQEHKLIRMCSSDAISIAELKRERMKVRDEMDRLRAASSPPECRPMTLEGFARLVIKGALGFQRLQNAREQKTVLEQIFSEVFFRHDTITAFRFTPSLVGSTDEHAKEMGRIINLEKPFRITPEIPESHKQCSKCLAILPNDSFRKGRLLCPDCFRVYNTQRSRHYRQRRTLNIGPQASA